MGKPNLPPLMPPLDTPRGYLELPISLAQPADLSPRPKRKKGSTCILAKKWEKHRDTAILPPEAFEPTEKELRKAKRIEREIDRRWRNRLNRDFRAAHLEAERERKKLAEREARKDPVKLAKRRAAYTKYNHSEKGKANRQAYEARLKTPEERQKRNDALRTRYANDPEYAERKRAYGRARYAAKPEEREAQKPARNARRKKRYATDEAYREKQKARARRDYERKKETPDATHN